MPYSSQLDDDDKKPVYSWTPRGIPPSSKAARSTGVDIWDDKEYWEKLDRDDFDWKKYLDENPLPPRKPTYGLGAASPSEKKVFGANRPGYPNQKVSMEQIKDWIDHVKANGIKRVVVLLDNDDLKDYYGENDLIAIYKKEFGDRNVKHVPIKDFTPPQPTQIRDIIGFINNNESKVVVHCSAGLGRTGLVLKHYLKRQYAMSDIEATKTVEGMGRMPREAEIHANWKEFDDKDDRVAKFNKKYEDIRPARTGWVSKSGGKPVSSRYAPAGEPAAEKKETRPVAAAVSADKEKTKEKDKKPSRFSKFWHALYGGKN